MENLNVVEVDCHELTKTNGGCIGGICIGGLSMWLNDFADGFSEGSQDGYWSVN